MIVQNWKYSLDSYWHTKIYLKNCVPLSSLHLKVVCLNIHFLVLTITVYNCHTET